MMGCKGTFTVLYLHTDVSSHVYKISSHLLKQGQFQSKIACNLSGQFWFPLLKLDDNGNFLQLLTSSLNLARILCYQKVLAKRKYSFAFSSFSKVSEGLGSSVCFIYTGRSLLRDVSWCEQYRITNACCTPWDYIVSTSETIYSFPVMLSLLFLYF